MPDLSKLVRTSVQEFLNDGCMSSAAAIAYYTIFSLPPLLVMLLALTNMIGFSREDIDRVFEQDLGIPVSQFGETTAPADGSKATPQAGKFQFDLSDLGAMSALLGSIVLIFAATGVFAELQYSLNKVWQVAPDPNQASWRNFLVKRLLSAGMVIVIWFGLLLSLVLTAINNLIMKLILGTDPGWIGKLLGTTVNEVTTFGLALVLFAAVFKILPDAKLMWRDVWGGAACTALLFVIGKVAIGWYLRTCPPGASWGASAASTAAALMWVYYSSIIILFGAELTEAWGESEGAMPIPEPGATRMPEPPPRYPRRRIFTDAHRTPTSTVPHP